MNREIFYNASRQIIKDRRNLSSGEKTRLVRDVFDQILGDNSLNLYKIDEYTGTMKGKYGGLCDVLIPKEVKDRDDLFTKEILFREDRYLQLVMREQEEGIVDVARTNHLGFGSYSVPFVNLVKVLKSGILEEEDTGISKVEKYLPIPEQSENEIRKIFEVFSEFVEECKL